MRFGTREQIRFALMMALLVALMTAWNARRVHAEEPWVITNLDATYQINKDGSVDVTEDYRVDFGTLSLKGIDRSVTNMSGSDLHKFVLDVISVDDGQTPLKYERKDVSNAIGDSIVISAGDPAKLLTGTQRFRFKYRLTRAITAAQDSDDFAWNIRGLEPFARIHNATISVSAPALDDVTCNQIPLSYLDPPIPCKALGNTATTGRFANTIDLGGVVGLTIYASLPKGAVTSAVVPTTPTTRTTAPTTTTSQTSSETEGGFKPVPGAVTVIAGLLGLALLVRVWRSSAINPARRVAINWLSTALILLVADVFVLVSGLDVGDWAWTPVLLLLSALVIGTSVVVGFIYLGRTGALDRMFNGEDLIVHWTYAPDEWLHNAEAEYESRRRLAITNMKLVTVVAVLIAGAMFYIGSTDENAGAMRIIGVLVGIAVFAFVALFNFLYVWTGDPRRGKPKDVWISLSGVYLFGALTTWKRNVSLASEFLQVELTNAAFLGNMLESVKLIETPDLKLQFEYSYWTTNVKSRATVEVPVPAGQEQSAQNVLAAFNGTTPPAAAGIAAPVA